MTENKQNLLSNIVLIRFFTIVIVVLGHSMIVFSEGWNIFKTNNHSAIFNDLKKYIDVFQMPLFLFVSGYIYSYMKIEKSKYNNYTSFLKNKFKRLIIPFVCIAIFYVIPIRELVNYAPYQGKSFFKIIFSSALAGNDIGHLWYLPTLFIIFSIFFILEQKKISKHYILNIFILIIISSLSELLPITLYIRNTAHYFLFFYLGYVVRNIYKSEMGISYPILIILFILQFTGFYCNNLLLNQHYNQDIIQIITVIVQRFSSICSIFFFYFSFTLLNKTYPKISSNKYIKFIDKESFPIYLFHSPLIYISLFLLADRNIDPFLLVLINFTFSLTGSLIISMLIQKTEKLNFIIGK